eukprot:4362568-Amphidinium_carterae.1
MLWKGFPTQHTATLVGVRSRRTAHGPHRGQHTTVHPPKPAVLSVVWFDSSFWAQRQNIEDMQAVGLELCTQPTIGGTTVMAKKPCDSPIISASGLSNNRVQNRAVCYCRCA